jgi:hypothetical protein
MIALPTRLLDSILRRYCYSACNSHYKKPGAPPPTHPVWGPTFPTGEHICVRVCALCQLGLGCAPRGAVRPIRIGSNTSFHCKCCRQLSCPSTWSAAGSLVQPRQQPPPCLHLHQSCRQYAAVRHCAPGLGEICSIELVVSSPGLSSQGL